MCPQNINERGKQRKIFAIKLHMNPFWKEDTYNQDLIEKYHNIIFKWDAVHKWWDASQLIRKTHNAGVFN